MPEKQDIKDTTASYLFKEMLKMKRREMGPGARKRTKSPQIRTLWLYPYAQERQYRKYVFGLLAVYSDMALPVLRNNLQRWVEEQRDDSRTDDFNTEFQQLINNLHQTQRDMFDEDGSGVDDDKGHFWNWLAIGASLKAVGFGISRFNQKQGDKITKRILGQPFIPAEPWLENTVKVWGNNNFGLIKSLSDEYIKKLNFIVSEGIGNEQSMNRIMKDVLSMDKNITKTRARLLTRDQVGKLNGRLTKRRSQEAGFDAYRWLTSADERVRPSHKKLHNKICKWDPDHLYADSEADVLAGNWKSRNAAGMYVGMPGQDIQCRCSSMSVFITCGAIGMDSISHRDAIVCKNMIEEIDKEIEKEEALAKGEKPPVEKPGVKKAPVEKKVEEPMEETIKKLQKRELTHYTATGSENKNVYKGLTKNEKEIAKSFVQLNEGRAINEIGALKNKGWTESKILKEGYTKKEIKDYYNISNYLRATPAYKGHITRLIRDDKGLYDNLKVGGGVEFNRLTSFGKKGNEFTIKGGNMKFHIEKNTRGSDISNLMPFKEEEEVLILKGKYKVKSKQFDGYFNHLYLEEK